MNGFDYVLLLLGITSPFWVGELEEFFVPLWWRIKRTVLFLIRVTGAALLLSTSPLWFPFRPKPSRQDIIKELFEWNVNWSHPETGDFYRWDEDTLTWVEDPEKERQCVDDGIDRWCNNCDRYINGIPVVSASRRGIRTHFCSNGCYNRYQGRSL